jgi:tetrahydromethanopterin S-methyltransferase subunit G
MDSDAFHALLEIIKPMNEDIKKISSRIESLENDYRERGIKKKIYKWLFTLYPLVIVIILFLIDINHNKMIEIASDVKELVSDVNDMAIYKIPSSED